MKQDKSREEGANSVETIEHLSMKLKKMQKMLPKLNHTQQGFSISTILKSQHLQISSPRQSREKEKIGWTSTATGWTRDHQPVHAIPKAKRFQESKMSEVDLYPNLDADLRSKIDIKGVTFCRQRRHELFQTTECTPSPNQYRCRRYLEGYGQKLGQRQFHTINPEAKSPWQHIKGGTIGKFDNHPWLHYDQGIKRNYNEKLIEQAKKERNKNRSFQIRINEKRNRSLI